MLHSLSRVSSLVLNLEGVTKIIGSRRTICEVVERDGLRQTLTLGATPLCFESEKRRRPDSIAFLQLWILVTVVTVNVTVVASTIAVVAIYKPFRQGSFSSFSLFITRYCGNEKLYLSSRYMDGERFTVEGRKKGFELPS